MQDCVGGHLLSDSAGISFFACGNGPGEARECKTPTNPTRADPNMLQNSDCWVQSGNYLLFWWIKAVAISILFGDAVS